MSLYTINTVDSSSVPNAPSGQFILFLDLDGEWKKKDDAGNVSGVSGADLNNKVGANIADVNPSFLTDKVNTVNGEITILPNDKGGGDIELVFGVGSDVLKLGANLSDLTNDLGFEGTSDLNNRDTANRDRSNHTGTQTASTISDFDSEVSNNTDVFQNTLNRHNPATVQDTSDINMSISGQNISSELTNTPVIAGTYSNANITVDSKGRLTFASDGGASSVIQEHAECYFATINNVNTPIVTPNTPVKIQGNTTFGLSSAGWSMPIDNRLQWNGSENIRVEVCASISMRKNGGGGDENFTTYIAQNGVVLIKSKASMRGDNSDESNCVSKCIVDLASGQYLETFIECTSDDDDAFILDLHFDVKQILI